VAARLAQRSLPLAVRVIDFGIRSLDLTYAMLEDYQAVILIDAMPRSGVPGTLYVLKPEPLPGHHQAELDGHSMDPMKVLQAVAQLGGHVESTLIVGCEPTPRDPDAEWEMRLSPPVSAAVPEAVELISTLIHDILSAGNRLADIQSPGGMDHESLIAGR
jgi:hydrogenase maturation protease